MIDLVSAETMQAVERQACEAWGMTTRLLMENAGGRIAEEAARIITERQVTRVFLVCGVGNNGGDGLVVARHLRSRFPSLRITVYLLGEREKMTPDTAANHALLAHLDVEMKQVVSPQDVEFERGALLIDALFGTGLKRGPQGIFAEVIEKMNHSSGYILSVDVPSGVEATRGLVWEQAVKAHLTVTLGKVKQGLVQFPAREYVGVLKLVDIGIPLRGKPDAYLLTPQDVRAFLPRRSWKTHKISAGVLGVVAGSSAMLGAGILLTLGAYRTGAGMVVWPLPEAHALLVKTVVPELVSIVLPQQSSSQSFHYTPAHLGVLKEGLEARKCRALAVGPGLGQERSTVLFVERLLEEFPLGGVLDADALNIVALHRARWEGRLSSWVLTPHAGEMGRLLEMPIDVVNQDRVSACRACAAYFGSVTVLKGAGTVVASPSGEVVINPTGGTNLATAGSGDVLTGVIGGLMVQGMEPWEAACSGVFLHGLAGDLLERRGKTAIIAREIAENIPEARRVVEHGEYAIPFLAGNRYPELEA